MLVNKGNLVGMSVAFKPGSAYKPGDTISLHYNNFEFVSFDENYSTEEPLYTPGDNDISFIVPSDVQYNQSIKEWDSLYIPSLAFLPPFQLQDHDFSYHITYTTGIQNIAGIVSGQTIYPNPASDLATLKYTLKTGAPVIINVYDITGKLIRSKNEGNVGAGLNQQLINTQDLADGVYLVSVEADGITSVSKLVVAR